LERKNSRQFFWKLPDLLAGPAMPHGSTWIERDVCWTRNIKLTYLKVLVLGTQVQVSGESTSYTFVASRWNNLRRFGCAPHHANFVHSTTSVTAFFQPAASANHSPGKYTAKN
jgi:hypothetical protein